MDPAPRVDAAAGAAAAWDARTRWLRAAAHSAVVPAAVVPAAGTAPASPAPFDPQPEQRAPRRRAPLIASLVAVVALAGGGAITYVALSDSSDGGGAASPKGAVENAVADMQQSDLVGLLDDLAPGERDALANPLRDDITKLKDLHVLNSNANANSIPGVTFKANNLTYGAKPIVINDHVQIVQLTGGTIDVTGDSSKLPFSDEFRAKAQMRNSSQTQHITVGESGPVRIATVKVGGRWYPSLTYTAADAAAGHEVPSAADAIPATGSSSAEDAVKDEVDALLAGDVKSALARISPAELGAIHDYGGMLVDRVPSWHATGVKIDTLDLEHIVRIGRDHAGDAEEAGHEQGRQADHHRHRRVVRQHLGAGSQPEVLRRRPRAAGDGLPRRIRVPGALLPGGTPTRFRSNATDPLSKTQLRRSATCSRGSSASGWRRRRWTASGTSTRCGR